MAYINKEKAAEIRANLKAQFPAKDGWQFSVTIDNYTSLRVAIMKAPLTFNFAEGYEQTHQTKQLNHFYLDNYENAEVLKRISAICNEGNHDRSDSMSDYFDVGWYFDFAVGKWNKPFVSTAPAKSGSTCDVCGGTANEARHQIDGHHEYVEAQSNVIPFPGDYTERDEREYYADRQASRGF